MATIEIPRETLRLAELQQRMGRVNHQPVSVHSFTNKRFTVNYRAPLETFDGCCQQASSQMKYQGLALECSQCVLATFGLRVSGGCQYREYKTMTCSCE